MNKALLVLALIGIPTIGATIGYFGAEEVDKYYEFKKIEKQVEALNDCIQEDGLVACDVNLD